MPPLFWQFDKFAAGNAFPISGFVAFGTGVLGVLWWLGGWVVVWLGGCVAGWLVGWLAFGTGEGLLWYRICVPCSKRPPLYFPDLG